MFGFFELLLRVRAHRSEYATPPQPKTADLSISRHIAPMFCPYFAGKAYRSRPSNPDEVWLDRTQLFLTTLRESCYRIVGSAARQGTATSTLI